MIDLQDNEMIVFMKYNGESYAVGKGFDIKHFEKDINDISDRIYDKLQEWHDACNH